jgi:hypothetical protein
MSALTWFLMKKLLPGSGHNRDLITYHMDNISLLISLVKFGKFVIKIFEIS